MGAAVSGLEIARLIDAAEDRIRTAVPMARVIYLEPDVHRSDLPSQAVVGGTGS
ncbi:hypothetical protein D3C86_2225800 [compost metagenome]